VIVGLAYSHFFGPVDSTAAAAQVIIPPNTSNAQAAALLKQQGIIRSTWAVRFAVHEDAPGRTIRAGAYSLGKNMDAWSVAKTLTSKPAMAFVTFDSGMRKEEMGDVLADALGWTPQEVQEWDATSTDPTLTEGVFYPDTYLIPSDQTPAQVAARMRGRFLDVYGSYLQEAQKKGKDWNDVLTLASIVDREAAKNDKALVAGILLNRLEDGMKLQADATLQYVKGHEGNWWPQPQSADKYLVSAFNTYQHTGLPPHPIDNPSVDSVAAVLDPVDTDCIYYLHDANHKIHCSVTYSGQKSNVEKYLK
jgi:UPF0755 protein